MASENIFAFQVWKLCKQIFRRVSAREIFQNSFHGITQATQARLPVADLRIDRNSRK